MGSATDETFEWRDPDKLQKHPDNIPTYGDAKSDQFLDETKNGIISPVIVGFLHGKETIVSGHRRVQAARIHGFKKVRCVIRRDLVDEDDILEALLKCNEQREKTEEQKGRERALKVKIEQRRAAKRQKSGLKKGDESPVCVTDTHTGNSAGKPTSETKTGRATAVVAAEEGVSATTVEASIVAVEAIDEAEAKGDTEAAQEIRDVLNTRGPNAAAKKVKADRKPRKKRTPKGSGVNGKLDFDDKQIDQAFGNLIRLCDRRADALKCKNSSRHKSCLGHLNSFIEEFNEWKAERR